MITLTIRGTTCPKCTAKVEQLLEPVLSADEYSVGIPQNNSCQVEIESADSEDTVSAKVREALKDTKFRLVPAECADDNEAEASVSCRMF